MYRHILLLCFLSVAVTTAHSAGESELAGLWEARRHLGPEVSGPLLLRRLDGRLTAEIAGYRVTVDQVGRQVSFELADSSRFVGELLANGNLEGHWIQPPSRLDSNVFATPVSLQPESSGRWRGRIRPQPDTGTFYLLLTTSDSGLSAELINPERNLGVFSQLSQLRRNGAEIALWGRFRGRGEQRVMLTGRYHADQQAMTIRMPGRGGSYDFRRLESQQSAGFLARRLMQGRFQFVAPPALSDGWSTASLESVKINPEPIRKMIETHILRQPDSSHDLSIHALLIARHGHLVMEEYFHGYHRDLPHDSRSASKSVTALLAAAAMQSGADLDWDSPVYSLFGQTEKLEHQPRRAALTLAHLVNMSSGLDCDDRNPDSKANEDYLWDHAGEIDFYQHTLAVPMLHWPGEVVAYCSASANLAGGVIARATGKSLLSLIQNLLAAPMNIKRYSVPVPPDGHPFMGGGIRWLPRDFLKFPQLLLDDGQWGGKQVISAENANLMRTPAVKMDGARDYAYHWWIADYTIQGKNLRAHFMGGNGGQIAMLVPELGLSLVFQAGNYSDRVFFQIQDKLIPEFILPAAMK